jgi:quercetin dioxygenase-like cupin family protein
VSEVYDLGATRLRVVVATEAATVIEGELDPGGGSTSHVHTREDETVVVVEGSLSVEAGERFELGAGDAVVIPRGQRHQFGNASDALTRLYFVCTPGGLERFFRDLAAGVAPEEAAERAGLEFT